MLPHTLLELTAPSFSLSLSLSLGSATVSPLPESVAETEVEPTLMPLGPLNRILPCDLAPRPPPLPPPAKLGGVAGGDWVCGRPNRHETER